jgi:hypothetical protein
MGIIAGKTVILSVQLTRMLSYCALQYSIPYENIIKFSFNSQYHRNSHLEPAATFIAILILFSLF